jgi:hypothetical protein
MFLRVTSYEEGFRVMMMSPSTSRTVGLSPTIDEYGVNSEGSGVLMLHGGAGPRSMAGLAAALSEHVYVITPTHPGFEGTPARKGPTPSPTSPRPTWTCSKPST